MQRVDQDFFLWIEQVPVTGVIGFPQARAASEIGAASAKAGRGHGRITLWLWRTKGKKIAFAMARIDGEGGGKPVRTVVGDAPPYRDDDKAQMVFEGERR